MFTNLFWPFRPLQNLTRYWQRIEVRQEGLKKEISIRIWAELLHERAGFVVDRMLVVVCNSSGHIWVLYGLHANDHPCPIFVLGRRAWSMRKGNPSFFVAVCNFQISSQSSIFVSFFVNFCFWDWTCSCNQVAGFFTQNMTSRLKIIALVRDGLEIECLNKLCECRNHRKTTVVFELWPRWDSGLGNPP